MASPNAVASSIDALATPTTNGQASGRPEARPSPSSSDDDDDDDLSINSEIESDSELELDSESDMEDSVSEKNTPRDLERLISLNRQQRDTLTILTNEHEDLLVQSDALEQRCERSDAKLKKQKRELEVVTAKLELQRKSFKEQRRKLTARVQPFFKLAMGAATPELRHQYEQCLKDTSPI